MVSLFVSVGQTMAKMLFILPLLFALASATLPRIRVFRPTYINVPHQQYAGYVARVLLHKYGLRVYPAGYHRRGYGFYGTSSYGDMDDGYGLTYSRGTTVMPGSRIRTRVTRYGSYGDDYLGRYGVPSVTSTRRTVTSMYDPGYLTTGSLYPSRYPLGRYPRGSSLLPSGDALGPDRSLIGPDGLGPDGLGPDGLGPDGLGPDGLGDIGPVPGPSGVGPSGPGPEIPPELQGGPLGDSGPDSDSDVPNPDVPGNSGRSLRLNPYRGPGSYYDSIIRGRYGDPGYGTVTRGYVSGLGDLRASEPGYAIPGYREGSEYISTYSTGSRPGYLTDMTYRESGISPSSGVGARSLFLTDDRRGVELSGYSGYLDGVTYDGSGYGGSSGYVDGPPYADGGVDVRSGVRGYEGVDVGSRYLTGETRYDIGRGSSGYIDTYNPLGVGSSGGRLRYDPGYPLDIRRGAGAVGGLDSEILRGGTGGAISGDGVGRRGSVSSIGGNGGDIFRTSRDAGLGSLRGAVSRAADRLRDIV